VGALLRYPILIFHPEGGLSYRICCVEGHSRWSTIRLRRTPCICGNLGS
jgi:hypothetical protein